MANVERRLSFIVGVLAIVSLLALDAHVLSRSPCLGVADILDFWRVARPAGIEHAVPVERPGYYVTCDFVTGPADLASAPSSSAVVAWLARHFSWGLDPGDDRMDLRQAGLTHLALLAILAGFGLIARLPAVLVAALLYVVSDPGYLLFSNSFYADPTLFVALFGLVLWLSAYGNIGRAFWGKPLRRWLTLVGVLVLLATLGGLSKMQYALLPLVLLLALIIPLVVAIFGDKRWRALAVGGTLIALSALAPWHFFNGAGPRFVEVNNYHAVYGGILKITQDPERVLRVLDIPPEHWDLPRRDVFSARIDMEHPIFEHLTPLSRLRLLELYLGDASALRGVRANSEATLAIRRAHPRGNYVRSPETPGITFFEPWWQFARLRGVLFGAWSGVPWLIVGLAGLWMLQRLLRKRWGPLESAMLFLVGWFASQVMIAVLGEGLINLHQHLIGARLGLDFLLVLLVYVAVRGIVRVMHRRPARI